MLRLIPRLAAVGVLAISALAAPISALAASQTWTVTTGGSPDDSIEAKVFGPGKITIDAGDSVTWHIGSKEPHTVSFGFPGPINPGSPEATAPIPGSSFDGTNKVSSGLLFQDYSLSFPKEGTFTYLCLIHPGMAGQIVVQPAGSAYPQTQADLSALGAQQIATAVSHTAAIVPNAKVTTAAGPNGSTTWTVPSSVGSGDASNMRFLGGNLNIKVGDTVTWLDTDPTEPHTVSFGTPPAGAPPDVLAFTPAGGKTYAGSGYTNQAFGPVPGLGKSYSLTFTAPGSFNYACLLHAELGMVGNITVGGAAPVQAPAQAPAQMPVTPSALPATGGGGPALPVWALGLGALLIAGGVTVLARSSRQS